MACPWETFCSPLSSASDQELEGYGLGTHDGEFCNPTWIREGVNKHGTKKEDGTF